MILGAGGGSASLAFDILVCDLKQEKRSVDFDFLELSRGCLSASFELEVRASLSERAYAKQVVGRSPSRGPVYPILPSHQETK